VTAAPVCKTDLLLALIRGGEWSRALSLANRFRLFPPDVKRAIRQGHAAGTNPRLSRAARRGRPRRPPAPLRSTPVKPKRETFVCGWSTHEIGSGRTYETRWTKQGSSWWVYSRVAPQSWARTKGTAVEARCELHWAATVQPRPTLLSGPRHEEAVCPRAALEQHFGARP
jgi:hypothetical protein